MSVYLVIFGIIIWHIIKVRSNEDVRVHYGTHGTCVSSAESIKATGFQPPKAGGRVGKGVYFWAHGELHSDIARRLAKGWYERANQDRVFDSLPRKEGAILWAKISVDEKAYLDFNDPNVEDTLNFLVAQARAGGDPNEQISPEFLNKMHEQVIRMLEDNLGHTIDVIRARVPFPKKMTFIEKIYVGHPNCYVVRNGFERIELLNVEYL